MKEENEYTRQAEKFLTNTGTKFNAGFIKHDYYFLEDKQKRDIYRITLKRNGHIWRFKFGQSVNASKTKTGPTTYDVLASVQKSEVGTYKDFCQEFGYPRSEESLKTYRAVCTEYKNVMCLFSDVIEELSEIQ